MSEYLRPWKLATRALGISLIVVGSFYYWGTRLGYSEKSHHGRPGVFNGTMVPTYSLNGRVAGSTPAMIERPETILIGSWAIEIKQTIGHRSQAI